MKGEENLVAVGAALPIALGHPADLFITRLGEHRQRARVVGDHGCDQQAETQDVEESAARKLAAKGLDMIVANDVSRPDAGFEVDTNRVVLLTAAGERTVLPLLAKSEVACHILAWLEARAGQP